MVYRFVSSILGIFFGLAPGLNFEKKKELINLVCSNFIYDGEKLTITIKKAFQPIVKIASLKNGGPSKT